MPTLVREILALIARVPILVVSEPTMDLLGHPWGQDHNAAFIGSYSLLRPFSFLAGRAFVAGFGRGATARVAGVAFWDVFA